MNALFVVGGGGGSDRGHKTDLSDKVTLRNPPIAQEAPLFKFAHLKNVSIYRWNKDVIEPHFKGIKDKSGTMNGLDLESSLFIDVQNAGGKTSRDSPGLRSNATSVAKRYTTPATPSWRASVLPFTTSYRKVDSPSRPTDPLDFGKLTSYCWPRADVNIRQPRVGPDKVYKHTYGTTDSERMNMKNSVPQLNTKKLQNLQNSLEDAHRSNARSNPKTAYSAVTSRRLLDRLHELQCMEEDFLNIKPCRAPADAKKGPEKKKLKKADETDILYSEVKKSIQLFYYVTHNLDPELECHHAHRPMKQEYGRYRPVSNTSFSESTLPDLSNGSRLTEKRHKSTDSYMRYMAEVRSSASRNRRQETPHPAGHKARSVTAITDYSRAEPSRPQSDLSGDGMTPRYTPNPPRGTPTSYRGFSMEHMGVTGRGITPSGSLHRHESLPSWASHEEEGGPSRETTADDDSISVTSKRETLMVDMPSAHHDNET